MCVSYFNNLVKDRLIPVETEEGNWTRFCVLGAAGFGAVFGSGLVKALRGSVVGFMRASFGLFLRFCWSWYVGEERSKKLPGAFGRH